MSDKQDISRHTPFEGKLSMTYSSVEYVIDEGVDDVMGGFEIGEFLNKEQVNFIVTAVNVHEQLIKDRAELIKTVVSVCGP